MSLVKAKLMAPAIALIVNAGINIAISLFLLMLPSQTVKDESMIVPIAALLILRLLASTFSIYAAIQMITAKQYGVATAGAIITLVFGVFFLPGILIGIWALIILLTQDGKSAFTGKSVPTT